MIKSLTSLSDLNMRTGADILLEVLESEGVEYIFGNPGTTELPLIDALLRHENIHYILALQESSVVAIADGYAKASGKTGFINLHTASGLGHGMGNLINSRIMKTPLVVTVGQQDTRHYVRDPLLYDDIVSIGSPVMKWAQEVTSADQLPVLVRCQLSSGRPGSAFSSNERHGGTERRRNTDGVQSELPHRRGLAGRTG